MPFRKTYKKRTYRRKTTTFRRRQRAPMRRRRYGNSKRITTACYVHRPLSGNGLPNQLTTKLKYCSAFTLTTLGVGALSTQAWNLNSLYDPDRTGVGHQPYLFDQIKVLYQTYLVYGCYVNIKLSPITASQAMIITAIRVNDDAASPPTSFDYLKEIGHTAFINIIAGATPKTYRRYVSISKALGVDFQSYMTDPDYKSGSGASPTYIPVLTLSHGSADGTSTPSFYVECTLTFYAKFQTLITAAQS